MECVINRYVNGTDGTLIAEMKKCNANFDCDKLKTMIGKEIENEIDKCFISN